MEHKNPSDNLDICKLCNKPIVRKFPKSGIAWLDPDYCNTCFFTGIRIEEREPDDKNADSGGSR